jgi:hypothetical protein
MARRTHWLALAALALALFCWAPAGAQVVARVDMLGGMLVPASSDPSADIASAQVIARDVARAVGGRNPRCLTAADAAQLDELARLLDAVRTYIDTQERGWTGSGFPKHSDIPGHGDVTAAEMALDGLKSSYWVLRGDFERLSRVPRCTPPPPGTGVMPGPPPGTSQPPEPPVKGGAATPGTGTGATQPGGEGGGVGPPEPPEDAPPPPASACRTAADDAYIAQETEHLDQLLTERDAKYSALQFREMELATAQTNPRLQGLSPDARQQRLDEDQREIEQEQQDIAALDATIFAVRANLAAERAKPPCEAGGKTGVTGQGGAGGVVGGGEGGGGNGGGGGVGNPFTPPPLPNPPPGQCRTPADEAYEQAVQAILDQAKRDRAAAYAELAPLLVEQYQIRDAIEAANGDAVAQARVEAAYSGRLQSLGQSVNQLQLKIEALDATITAAEARLKHKKPPCQDGRTSMAVPPPPSEGQTAAVQQDEGPVLQGLGVRVQKSKGPNRAAGEEGSGEEGSGESGTSQTPSRPSQQSRPGD